MNLYIVNSIESNLRKRKKQIKFNIKKYDGIWHHQRLTFFYNKKIQCDIVHLKHLNVHAFYFRSKTNSFYEIILKARSDNKALEEVKNILILFQLEKLSSYGLDHNKAKF